MKEYLTLLEIAQQRMKDHDPSHDFEHALRVLGNAEYITAREGGDKNIIYPAAILHDIVMYSKNDPRSDMAADESAEVAEEILISINYPREKLPSIKQAIREHSYNKKITPKTLESQIVQDADRLECTGAIAIMRTFASIGNINGRFYDTHDPFCQERSPSNYAIDLFFKRLLKVGYSMNTKTAKQMAEERTNFLYEFLHQFKHEINYNCPHEQRLNEFPFYGF